VFDEKKEEDRKMEEKRECCVYEFGRKYKKNVNLKSHHYQLRLWALMVHDTSVPGN
jgi:hypothetical protein